MTDNSESTSTPRASPDPKLRSLASAADDLAEMIAAETERLKSESETNPDKPTGISVLKDLTATVKNLAGIIRDLNDLPPAADREAREMARMKFEQDMARRGGEEEAVTFVLGEGMEEYCG